MKTRDANSIQDVVGIVSEARKEWRLPMDRELWFRGEDAKYLSSTLQPKLYRHLPASVSAVSDAILRKEAVLFEEFIRCGTQLYEHDDVEDWDWYFLMQHHGAPTRLLDWSDGCLMATHFSVSGDVDKSEGAFMYVVDPYALLKEIDEHPENEKFIASWKAHRKHRRRQNPSWSETWDDLYIPGFTLPKKSKSPHPRPAMPDTPLVMEFPQFTRRVAAQRSRFMACGRNKNWLADWAALADSRIWRIFIQKDHFAEIKQQLRDAGMTESVIFPDLDGLGRELNELWSSLKKKRSLSK